MRPPQKSLAAPLFAALSAAALSAALALTPGCGGEPEAAGPADLARAFPAQAEAVTARGGGFVASELGFSGGATEPSGGFNLLAIDLPSSGEGFITMRAAGGFEVRVREVAANSAGVIVNQAVMYRRPGVTSYWTAGPNEAEEWLHIKARRSGGPAAAWEILGASPEQRGDAIAILDKDGAARLWVSAPSAYAASGAPLAAKLSARGSFIELAVDEDEDEILVDPAWMQGPPMMVARADHTATILPTGRLLVAGGYTGAAYTNSAQVFLQDMMMWSPASPLAIGRARHTATGLDNGDVLIAGGFSGVNQASVELFSADSYSFAPASPMAGARSRHTATKLATGQVLVVGGVGPAGALASTEIYDPTTGAWASAGSLTTARSEHTATRVANGDVLIIGGKDAAGAPLASVEIYMAAKKKWMVGPAMSSPRYGHTATLLYDGLVLVVGGSDGVSPLATAQIFTPGLDIWTNAAPMLQARAEHTAETLPFGYLLISGGTSGGATLSSAELYDPVADEWRSAGAMSSPRQDHTTTALEDGRVIVVGGSANGVSKMSDEFYAAMPLGAACSAPTDCLKGFCVDGVCCDSKCDAGACDACSIAAGAEVDGLCKTIDDVPCDDKNLCTKGDKCQSGVCVGQSAILCPQIDPCHGGVCNPSNGKCENAAFDDGTECQDGNQCFVNKTCQAGVCVGDPIICQAFDLCHDVGVCEPDSGKCSNPSKQVCELPGGSAIPPAVPPDVILCDDGSKCPSGFCVHGVCCDSKCDTPCMSCVLPGSMGKCTLEPKGVDVHHHCDMGKGGCNQTCSGDPDPMHTCVDVEPMTQCSFGQCFEDGIHGAGIAFCSEKGELCPLEDRIPFNCSPYKCYGPIGMCRTTCTSSLDCQAPFVCDPDGHCISAPAVESGHSTSCASSSPGAAGSSASVGGGPPAFSAALLALALAARRRRERPAGSSHSG